MQKKSTLSFSLVVAAIIIFVALSKQFDRDTMEFGNPALAAVYGATLAAIAYFTVRSLRKPKP